MMIVRLIVELLRCLMGLTRQLGTPRQLPVAGVLLPGLPDSLVRNCILPRIPWHVRPLLRATNLAWREALDSLSPCDCLLARSISRKSRRSFRDEDGVPVKVQTLKGGGYVMSLYDQEGGRWRNLPMLPCGFVPPVPVRAKLPGLLEKIGNSIHVACVSGKVIAACISQGLGDDCVAHVWILDIEGGMWKWEERPSIHTQKMPVSKLSSMMITMKGKVFISRDGTWDENKPLVYDVARDEWVELPDAFDFHDVYSHLYYALIFHDEVPTIRYVHAWGINNGRSDKKVLDPSTLRWMDF